MPKTLIAVLVSLTLAPLTAACLLGGGGNEKPSALRPGSIPTATPPASLPEPVVVGETQAGSGAAPNTAVSGEQTYVVKSGDTLGSIAASLGIPVAQQPAWIQQVLQLNAIPDATLLQSGVALTLPRLPATPRPSGSTTPAPTTAARTATPGGANPTATSPASNPTPRSTPLAGGGAGTYTVASGDYPILIAQKLGVPAAQQSAWADQLLALNGIDASALQPGQVLQTPPIPASPTATP